MREEKPLDSEIRMRVEEMDEIIKELEGVIKEKERLEMYFKKIPFIKDISPEEAEELLEETISATLMFEACFENLIRFNNSRKKNKNG